MKSIIRLALLVSVFGIIYFISNKNEVKEIKTTNVDEVEVVEQVDSVEQTEIVEEKSKTEVNPILVVGQTITYSNGDIKYTVEMNEKEEITITKFQPNEIIEAWSWMKRQCSFKTNSIRVDWVDTEYIIKNNELVVVENNQTKKYQIIW